eukprot:g12874.t1
MLDSNFGNYYMEDFMLTADGMFDEHDFKGSKKASKLPKGLFEDAEFPATNESIGGVTGDNANPLADYLKDRPESKKHGAKPGGFAYKLFASEGEPCLFKHASPRDIEQGYLGDCWMVSSFSAVAEYPDRIRSLFKQHELTADGRYDVRLYDPQSEEWKVITIDDRLPFWKRPGKHGNLCFAKPTKENEFWPCLLEKAVAKFVKSYHRCSARIDGGWESVALEMLTGKPSLCIQISPDLGGTHAPYAFRCGKDEASAVHATVAMRVESYDADWGYWSQDRYEPSRAGDIGDEWLWDKLKAWNQEGQALACNTRQNYKGILANHASRMCGHSGTDPRGSQIERWKPRGTSHRLIHVRNPHATNEWFGRFHDDDWETWNKYPEALEATGHKVGIKDNGVFWMDARAALRGRPNRHRYKQAFSDVAVNFSAEVGGARYTDLSPEAQKHHAAVAFGTVGHQAWTGLKEALEILKASDVHIDLVGWNALMALSLHLLSESLLTNLQPDIISYNSVITACSGHHWPLALHLLFFSRQARLVPSIISFNAAIAACDKGHQWQKALQLFQDLQEEHVSPTRVTYNSLLSACEVGLPWSSLLHLLSLSQHLPEHRGEADAWAAVASACAKTLAWAVALDALEVIRMTMPEAAWHATLRACALALKRSALVLLHQGQCQQLQMPRSSDVSSLLVAARGERWSTAEGGRPFHAWQLEEVRRAAVQADESVEETNPNAQLARAALNSLHVVRTKSVLTFVAVSSDRDATCRPMRRFQNGAALALPLTCSFVAAYMVCRLHLQRMEAKRSERASDPAMDPDADPATDHAEAEPRPSGLAELQQLPQEVLAQLSVRDAFLALPAVRTPTSAPVKWALQQSGWNQEGAKILRNIFQLLMEGASPFLVPIGNGNFDHHVGEEILEMVRQYRHMSPKKDAFVMCSRS